MPDSKASITAFHEQAWALVEAAKRHDEPKREHYRRLSDLYETLDGIQEFRDKISIRDLDAFFHDILFNTKRRSIEKVTKLDVETALRLHLLHEGRDFDFYFGPYMVAGLPRGVELGFGQLRPFDELPAKAQEYISAHRGRAPFRDKGGSIPPKKTIDRDWFLYLRVKTVGWMDALEKAQLGMKRTLSAYELVTGAMEFMQGFVHYQYGPGLDQNFYMFCDVTDESHHYKVAEVPLFIGNLPGSEELVDDMTLILRKNTFSELESRILAVVDIFGMIDDDTPLNVKFLLKVIALEALLLSEDDRDYLGWKLAEKIAYLLGDNKYWIAFSYEILPHLSFLGNAPEDLVKDEFVKEKRSESRARLNKEVVRLYRKRSAFAHQQGRRAKEQVIGYDYDMVSWLLRLSVITMLALSKRGITHLKKQKTVDPSSFDGLIEKLKY
jgi:hypothetical protein